MDTSTIQLIALLILLVVLLANAVVRRREKPPMRPIGAYETATMTAGSIEAGRPLHFSLGSATVGDERTLLALVGAEFLYYLTREVAVGDRAPIITVSEGAAVPLAMDTLRRAYTDEKRPAQFKAFNARWYPQGTRSLAFAAALTAMQGDDRIGGNMLAGRYGVELALVLDASNRHNLPSVAVSDQLEGQAIAFAMATEPLIGEEIFAAAGYLSDDLKWSKRNLVIDLSRWLLAVAIVALLIFNIVTGGS